MHRYYLNESDQIIIEDFQNSRAFASFLPGIAGPMGVPLWVFYVNRGQAIASFGVENKDNPILEFQPANKAYQLTSLLGFRSFMRIQRDGIWKDYEPFIPGVPDQKMIIGMNELSLQEVNRNKGIQTDVVYFLLPEENFSGLVRMVKVTNLAEKPTNLELLDGLPAIIPYGVNNQILKEISRTVEAWMEVYNLEYGVPYYRLRASVADSSEVSSFEPGHYMVSFRGPVRNTSLLPVIVDPSLVFGNDTSLRSAESFYTNGLEILLDQTQITCGKTPCGFSAAQVELAPGESVYINSIFGHVHRMESINSQVERLTGIGYMENKRQEACALVRNLTDTITCRTSDPMFDAYCRQTFIDNTLRGGYPVIFGEGKEQKIYHIFSRKHGDLERDYNAFSFSSEFYSQGNGNYRDVNQNRREDIWFYPSISDFDIRMFMSLIQADGYNPLIVNGSRFFVLSENRKRLLKLVKESDKLGDLFSRSFSPGGLIKDIMDQSLTLNVDIHSFIEQVMENSEQHIQASTGEGYWIDHWTYNQDLIESYLAVFPDRKDELLFLHDDLPFYDSHLVVMPRARKYVLVDGKPRQLGSVIEDRRKRILLETHDGESTWLRVAHGNGAIYHTNLFSKLFILALIKFATLDPCGMGIEMEAGRPGWDDALNGLPGMFGSSMAETYALKRLIIFLVGALPKADSGVIRLPVEMIRLLRRVVNAINHYFSQPFEGMDHHFWNSISSAREIYRRSIRLGLDGKEEEIAFSVIGRVLDSINRKLDDGISRALEINDGLPPTFFIYLVSEFELVKDKHGNQKKDAHGRSIIKIKRFTPQPLPLFLEGMVRAMSVLDAPSAERLYERVKESPLFDRNLNMYKINASLDDLPKDIGRARAFTPGWLENESVWLHMEYKYLLEVIKAGMYASFFEDIKTALIPFIDPKVYGRSPLENSSFLVSSVHPDKQLHGVGFVARLSGASAEFLSMWRIMMAGAQPFFLHDDQLCLAFKPILPDWLFDVDNSLMFKFLGNTSVVYHNPHRRATFKPGTTIRSMIVHPADGDSFEITGGVIPAPHARNIRDGRVKGIDVYFA